VFPHEITIKWSEADGAYLARVEAVKASAKGDTPEAALRAVLKAAGVETESAAATLGRAGGMKGGAARAAALSKKKRSEIAQKAAQARWKT
jgi:hypothetical protein